MFLSWVTKGPNSCHVLTQRLVKNGFRGGKTPRKAITHSMDLRIADGKGLAACVTASPFSVHAAQSSSTVSPPGWIRGVYTPKPSPHNKYLLAQYQTLSLLIAALWLLPVCGCVVRKTNKVHRNINGYDFDSFRARLLARRKTQDTLYPRAGEGIERLLSGFARNGDDAEVDSSPFQRPESRDVLNRDISHLSADLPAVIIKRGSDLEPVCEKPRVSQDGKAQVAYSNQGCFVDYVEFKDCSDLLYELFSVIALARMSQLSLRID